jgi:hypothetical protein
VEKQYGKEEIARHSYFEKLNFDAIKEIIQQEGIDCEFKFTGGGWDIFLTDEEFNAAKRDVERMKASGGYTSSLKIFEGPAAAEVIPISKGRGFTNRLLESSSVRVQYSRRKELRYDLIPL